MGQQTIVYTPEEAAYQLRISRAYLYQLLASGEITSVKIGRSRRISATDLAAFVDRLRGQTQDRPDAAEESDGE